MLIDLRNLTKKHFEEAEATKPGECSYSAPCIIGTLMPENERDTYVGAISSLVKYRLTEALEDQVADMEYLQMSFDRRDSAPKRYQATKQELAQKYGWDLGDE